MKRIDPGPGRESVWDYPRPPRLEPEPRPVRVVFAGTTIAETERAWRVLETSHPPGIYLPPADVMTAVLLPNGAVTMCEWKGRAAYWDVAVGTQRSEAAAWSYPDPTPAFKAIDRKSVV